MRGLLASAAYIAVVALTSTASADELFKTHPLPIMDSEKEVALREQGRRALIRALIAIANSKTHDEAVTIAQRQLIKAGQTWYVGSGERDVS